MLSRILRMFFKGCCHPEKEFYDQEMLTLDKACVAGVVAPSYSGGVGKGKLK
jgi:hypothetical protein